MENITPTTAILIIAGTIALYYSGYFLITYLLKKRKEKAVNNQKSIVDVTLAAQTVELSNEQKSDSVEKINNEIVVTDKQEGKNNESSLDYLFADEDDQEGAEIDNQEAIEVQVNPLDNINVVETIITTGLRIDLAELNRELNKRGKKSLNAADLIKRYSNSERLKGL